MKRTTFSEDIVCSGRFLSLQPEAQALYLQLAFSADAAGVCDKAEMIARRNYGLEALEDLETAGFLFKIGDIHVIAHYVKNNTLRHLHLSRSHYRELIATELSLSEDGVYKLKNPAKIIEKPAVKTSKKATSDATESSLAVEILGYLNQRTGRSYSTDTAAHMRLINGRINDGHGLEDFMLVIDSKVAEWGKDQKMSKYLRPSTLFLPGRFDEYLQAAKSSKPVSKFEAKTSDTAGVHGKDFFGF